MAKRHGLSHAIATLVSLIVSGFLVRILFLHYPILYDQMIGICKLLKDIIQIPLTAETFAVMLLASFFAFLWGIMFFYINQEHRYDMN